jgi:hypothetical protein
MKMYKCLFCEEDLASLRETNMTGCSWKKLYHVECTCGARGTNFDNSVEAIEEWERVMGKNYKE